MNAKTSRADKFCKKNIEKICRSAAITNPPKDQEIKTLASMLQITPSFYEKTHRQELARARFLCD